MPNYGSTDSSTKFAFDLGASQLSTAKLFTKRGFTPHLRAGALRKIKDAPSIIFLTYRRRTLFRWVRATVVSLNKEDMIVCGKTTPKCRPSTTPKCRPSSQPLLFYSCKSAKNPIGGKAKLGRRFSMWLKMSNGPSKKGELFCIIIGCNTRCSG